MPQDIKLPPTFTEEHLEYLNRVYPEIVDEPKSTEQMYMRLGTRQVVRHIATIIEQEKARKLRRAT